LFNARAQFEQEEASHFPTMKRAFMQVTSDNKMEREDRTDLRRSGENIDL
jgi:hypothetical protein